jgi:hypothetical protein
MNEMVHTPQTALARQTSGVAASLTRAAQEVQAAIIVAQQCPRDTQASYQRIMTACQRKSLAEHAMYEYPRGGQRITGPSIRLAEAMAQNWGNLDFGITELEQRDGESDIMAYCWDLETNVRQTKTFTVRHVRKTKTKTVNLDDPRDIYETTANQGARRLRACILGIIPGDVQDAAVAECTKTLSGNNSTPIEDRVRFMLTTFEPFGVTKEMIEKRLGHDLDAVSEHELVLMQRIYTSLRDNMSQREDHFEVANKQKATTTELQEPKSAASSEQPPTEQPQPKSPPIDELKGLLNDVTQDINPEALNKALNDAGFGSLADAAVSSDSEFVEGAISVARAVKARSQVAPDKPKFGEYGQKVYEKLQKLVSKQLPESAPAQERNAAANAIVSDITSEQETSAAEVCGDEGLAAAMLVHFDNKDSE